MRRLIPLFVAVALFATACGDDSSVTETGAPGDGGSPDTTTTVSSEPDAPDPDSPAGMLEAARQRWAENGLSSYELTTSEICFCPENRWVNTVVDGVVTEHRALSEDSFFDPGPRTMETLFDEIGAAIDEGYASLDVEYDPETGAVVRYWVDVDEMIADEEHGVEVTALTPFDPSAEPVDVGAEALVDDYPCGYGFTKGDGGQTLGLFVYWQSPIDPDGPDVSAPITLPADDWNAELRTGTDLFANWCDDVMEPDEPIPAVDETWTLVTGTLAVVSEVPGEGCGGATVQATLTDAVFESASGEQLGFGPVDLANTGWGCFAG